MLFSNCLIDSLVLFNESFRLFNCFSKSSFSALALDNSSSFLVKSSFELSIVVTNSVWEIFKSELLLGKQPIKRAIKNINIPNKNFNIFLVHFS